VIFWLIVSVVAIAFGAWVFNELTGEWPGTGGLPDEGDDR
jgi:hypothetical protein